VGDQLRGVASAMSAPIPPVPGWAYAGQYAFSTLVYGENGDEITFVYQDDSGTQFSASQTLTFVADGDAGSYQFPIVLTVSSTPPPPSSTPSPPPSMSPSPPPSMSPSPPPTSSGGSLPSEVDDETRSFFSDSFAVIAVVLVGGATQSTGLVGAYVGDQLRGVASAMSAPIPPVPGWAYAGQYAFSTLVYGENGDEITFVYQDDSGTQFSASQTLTFVADGDAGSYQFPIELTVS